jgi:hypothetical protein
MRNLSRSAPLTGGGTISGDLTITGDLTVQGSATNAYDEQVQGRFDVLIDAADGGTTPFIKIIDADTDTTANTKSQILFSKYSSGTSAVDAGSIDVGITQWDTTSSNRHTYMTFNTVNAGNIGERVRITNTGDVGIGCTPDAVLTIAESAAKRIQFRLVDGQAGIQATNNSDSNDTLRIKGYRVDIGNSAGDLYVNESGNVFINQTAYSNNSDHTLIGIGGNAGLHATTAVGASGELGLVHNLKNTGSAWVTISTDEHTMYTQAGGNHNFYAWASASAGATVSEWTNSKVAIFDANSRISLSNNDGGASNTVFGYLSGASLASGGNENCLFGHHAGNELKLADRNIAIGYNAMFDSYIDDTQDALTFDNVFIGYGSGSGTWTGAASKGNIGIGTNVMDAAMNTAYYNTAVGDSALSGLTSGDDNVAIGGNAGKQLTSGDDNTFVGYSAGTALGSASSNVAIGHSAFATQANASAVGNVAVGASALKDMNGAHIRNIAIGLAAMENASTATTFQDNVTIGAYAFDDSGTNNQTGTVAIGSYALTALAAGTDNTAVGYKSLFACNAGTQNTALGTHALYGTDDGVSNTAVGAYAMHVGNAGDSNTAIGAQALIDVTGSHNVAVGFQALFDITSGGSNIAIGSSSMKAMVGGESDNIAIGVDSMSLMDEDNETIDKNVAIGTAALKGGDLASTSNDYEQNVAIGYHAMDGTGTIGGSDNVFIGVSAGGGSWTGGSSTKNVGIGAFALDAGLNGAYSNIAIGYDSLGTLTTGDANVAIGAYFDSTYKAAMFLNTAGNNCIAIGSGALQTTNHDAADGTIAIGHGALRLMAPSSGSQFANSSIGIGYEALKTMTTATGNIAIGHSASALVTGSLNTVIGFQAADVLAAGSSNTVIGARAMGAADGGEQNNVIIGTDAGDVINDDAADGNVIIGQDADPSGSAGTNQIVIGQGATGVGDNSVTLGNADVLNVYAAQDGAAHVHCSGISFPATQSASGGANTQDDYEEGDWTPVLSDGSNNATSAANTEGTYTKIGRQVTVIGRIQTSSLGSVSGGIQINGLPFTAGNDDKYKSVGNIGLGLNLNVTAGYNIDGYIPANGATLLLYINDAATGATAMTGAEWSADGHAIIQATYFV